MRKTQSVVVGLIALAASPAAFAVPDACDAYGYLNQRESVLDGDSSFAGGGPGEFVGKAIVDIGDFNNDGLTDFASGAHGVDVNGADSGVVYIWYGRDDDMDGTQDPFGAVDGSAPDARLLGAAFEEEAGWDVARVGDVNNDGIDDILVGSNVRSFDYGKAYLVYGGDTVGPLGQGIRGDYDMATFAHAEITSDVTADAFGNRVKGVGDVNNDGFQDFLVGAHKDDTSAVDAGRAYLFLGPQTGDFQASDAEAIFEGTVRGGWFGFGLAGLGDINGDGYDDFMIGATKEAPRGNGSGAAYVFFGSANPSGAFSASSADIKLLGQNVYAGMGGAGSRAGDVNGDGFNDFWITSPGGGIGYRGFAYLFLGTDDPTLPGTYNVEDLAYSRVMGDNGNDFLGTSIDGGEDFDGDGTPDVLIGAYNADGDVNYSGAGFVIHGLPPVGTFDLGDYVGDFVGVIGGATYGDRFGDHVSAVPDFNGDGFAEAVVGGWRANYNGGDSGAGALFFGGQDLIDESGWYIDADGDGYGDEAYDPLDPAQFQLACEEPTTGGPWAPTADDCDDTDPAYRPGAPEGSSDPDYNCDGSFGATDADGDGYVAFQDCDDTDPLVYDGAPELCDGKDNDCNGTVDDELQSTIGAVPWYADADGDGYGDDPDGTGSSAVWACEEPDSFLVDTVNIGGDCRDADPAVDPAAPFINPGAVEYCDGIDNNCLDGADEATAVDTTPWFEDVDVDGYGEFGTLAYSCDPPTSGSGSWVTNADDCDDDNPSVNPGVTDEVCDFQDNDCDGAFYLGGPEDASERFRFAFQSEEVDSRFGQQVGFIGDWDGDPLGTDEMVVSAAREDANGIRNAGAVYVRYGNGLGETTSFTEVKADGSTNWDVKFYGTRADVFVGVDFAAGDFNGDGTEDLAIGSPAARVPSAGMGAVYVFYGPVAPGEYAVEQADAIFKGGTVTDNLGASLAVLDFDGDGDDDLIMGAPGVGSTLNYQGAVYVAYGGTVFPPDVLASTYAGSAGATFLGTTAGEASGTSVANAGNLFPTGTADSLLIGGKDYGAFSDGVVYAIAGSDTFRPTGNLAPDVSIIGQNRDMLGLGLAGGEDIDGDGTDDVLIGTDKNRAYLLYGATLSSGLVADVVDITFLGGFSQNAGQKVEMVGDVDGDGMSEFLIAAPGDSEVAANAGAAYLLYGYDDIASRADNFAVDLEEVESEGRLEAGTTFPTYSAFNFGVMEGAKIRGEAAGDNFGFSIGAGGDFNGDGTPDIFVGAVNADFDSFTSNSGKVYAFPTGRYGVDKGVDPADLETFYADLDTDGYADESLVTFQECAMHLPISFRDPAHPIPAGTTDISLATDCDDTDFTVYPGAPETISDGIDSDCDGFDNPNQLPIVASLNITTDPLYTATAASATVTVDDPDMGTTGETPIDAIFSWFVDGTFVATSTVNDVAASGYTATQTLTPAAFAKGQAVRVRVELDDGRIDTDAIPLPFDEDTVIVQNSAPSIDSCSITVVGGGDLGAADVVDAGWGGLMDDDVGDALALGVDVVWFRYFGPVADEFQYRDGSFVTGPSFGPCASLDLPIGRECERGVTLFAKCTPTDGEDEGLALFSNELTVLNTPPEVECNILPGAPTTEDDLEASCFTTDVDGDAVFLEYEWEVDGVLSAETGAVVDSSVTNSFEVWRLFVTPQDSWGDYGARTPALNNPKEIANTAPTRPEIDLLPNSPRSEQDLFTNITTLSTDVDGDPITYRYYWTVDGEAYGDDPAEAPYTFPTDTLSTVGKGLTVRDQEWQVCVEAFDGYSPSPQDCDSVTILNTPPAATGASIVTVSPTTADDIEVQVDGWYDEDGDPIQLRAQWYVDDGTGFALVSTDTGGPTLTLDSSETLRGYQVYAEVTPFDGLQFGSTTFTSNTVTVVNYVPDAPLVRVIKDGGAPSDQIGEFDDLRCDVYTGSFDADGDTITYSYAWYVNGVLDPSLTAVTVPSTETAYAEQWHCTATPNDGFTDGAVGTAIARPIEDTTKPPAPTIASIDRYRNETSVSLSGTCVPGPNDCNVLTVHCSDSFGSRSATTTCSGGGTWSRSETLVRGDTTSCYATCTDVTQTSDPSANVLTDVCSTEDVWEASGGDSWGASLDEWGAFLDDGSGATSIIGNVPTADTSDHFLFRSADQLALDRTARRDVYNFEVQLATGAAEFEFDVRIGSASAPLQCGGGGYDDFQWINWTDYAGLDALHRTTPADRQACAASTDTSFFSQYNGCEDFTEDYYVRVYRQSGFSKSCNPYELTVRNGAPSSGPR